MVRSHVHNIFKIGSKIKKKIYQNQRTPFLYKVVLRSVNLEASEQFGIFEYIQFKPHT